MQLFSQNQSHRGSFPNFPLVKKLLGTRFFLPDRQGLFFPTNGRRHVRFGLLEGRPIRGTDIEWHHDIRPKLALEIDDFAGGEVLFTPIDVRREGHPVRPDFANAR